MNRLTEAQIHEAVDHLAVIAKTVIEACGNHDPMALFYGDGGVKILGMAPIMNEAEARFSEGDVAGGYAVKDQMADVMKSMALKEKAFGVITIIEAWAKRVSPSELMTIGGDQPGMGSVIGPLPRFDKDREEVLIIAYEFKLVDDTKKDGVMTMKIVRSGGKATLEAPEKIAGAGDGRLTNILQ